jgi:hypothetical protein
VLQVWLPLSTSPPPTFALYPIVAEPLLVDADADIDAWFGNGTVVVTENGIAGLVTVTLPLVPAYVSDETSPSPVTLAVYCTLMFPLPSVNSVGPIDRGGLHAERPPGPLPLDPHPTATTTNAIAAMLRLTFELFISREATGDETTEELRREPTERRRVRQPNPALAFCGYGRDWPTASST